MSALQISRDIVPIGEFKAHSAQVLNQLHEGHRPLVITQNGRPAAVMLAPEEYDRLVESSSFVAAVKAGLADADAGRLLDDDQLEREMEAALRDAE